MNEMTNAHRNASRPYPFRPLLEPGEYGEKNGMRPGTRTHRYSVSFCFNNGGMGDYINYAAAIKWIGKNCPWIAGTLYVSGHLVPLFKILLKDLPDDWQILSGEEIRPEPDTPLICPEMNVEGRNATPQFLNPTGCHPIDLGFAYYANKCPAPADVTIPELNFTREQLPHKIRGQEGKYVVITAGAMTPSRILLGKHLNPFIEHVKSRGLIPLFLGKTDIAGNLKASFPDDVLYSEGIDLREQTTVLEAGAIMQYAAAVMGLDNGLLNLAACTPANLIYGYNIVEVSEREPRRKWGRLKNISLTTKELSCAGCQAHLKHFVGHSFHRCLYKDNKCIDILFEDGARRWCQALDEILKEIGHAI